MDFQKAVMQSLERLVKSEELDKLIHKHLAQTCERIIADALSQYSDFGKQLAESVKESLKVGDRLDLPSYNDTILKVVRRQVEGYTNAVIQREVAGNLEKLLKPAPETITLSKLVDLYREHLQEWNRGGCHCHGDQRMTLNVESSDYNFRYVEFDDEPGRRRFECDIRLGVDSSGKVFSLSFKNQDVEKQMFAGPFYGFERALFQMKAAGTKIEFDCDESDIDLNYSLSEV